MPIVPRLGRCRRGDEQNCADPKKFGPIHE
jgi:hypothetical protein